MKRIRLTIALCTLLAGGTYAQSADSTGMPGDNFSLEGALEVFKESNSIEEFEQKINSEGSDVNNLDLNQDGEVDFVQVNGFMEGTSHAFVLSVAVTEQETQDIAVIELEKTGEETAMIQILGDEEVYGETKIVEPADVGPNKPAKGNGPSLESSMDFVVVNVWLWPSVRFAYAPAYRPWVTPYRWGMRPVWWHPWRIRPWRVHWGHCAHYRARHHVVVTHRTVHVHRVYGPHRRTSVTVVHRHAPAKAHYHKTHVVVHKGPAGPGPKGGKKGGGRRR